jgi:YVTN family beta-propeller protein
MIASVPAGTYPYGLTHNSTDNKVYCANAGSANLTVIDGASDTVITTIPVGDGPTDLVYNSTDNKVYSADNDSYTVTVIDGPGDTVVTTVHLGIDPWKLTYSPATNRVYCTGANAVAVIDGAGDTVLTTISVGNDPYAIVWNSTQNRIYTANYRGSSVSIIKEEMTQVQEEHPFQKTSLALSRNCPNPFRHETTVQYSLAHESRVSLRIYNLLGQEVRVLVDGIRSAGMHSVKWDARDDHGRTVSPGPYFLRMQVRDHTATRKLSVMR